MPCNPVKLPSGETVIACSRTRARSCSCGRPSTKLCDYQLTGPKTGQTCDKPICERCAVSPKPGLDYCGAHARLLGIE